MISMDVYELEKATRNNSELWYGLLEAGTVQSGHLVISREAFDTLMERHYGADAPGNVLHRLLKPVAAVIGLGECGGCAKRQIRLNEAGKSDRNSGIAAR